ncbi:MAG TPA: aspartyl-phosphate phosphatase Spo0E family protein [Patescibacteria group bacterium]|nr:aspartyl-phosphate phosphatase Spo0E family protein [Patescibacteria group bacterium]
MTQREKILKEIEMLRVRLNKLVFTKNNLQDKEILEISALLDSRLNEYNQLSDEGPHSEL